MADNTMEYNAYHLADRTGDLFEIQRANNFDFLVTFDDDDLVRAGVDVISDRDKISGSVGREAIRLAVVKASVPNFSQEVIEIKRGNTYIKAAGIVKFESGNLVVNDFIGLESKSVLEAWQRLSFDITTEKIGKMSQYKKDCTLQEYTPDYELVRSWTLKGCWVSKISEDDFNMEESGKKTITATIEFDRAIPFFEYGNTN